MVARPDVYIQHVHVVPLGLDLHGRGQLAVASLRDVAYRSWRSITMGKSWNAKHNNAVRPAG